MGAVRVQVRLTNGVDEVMVKKGQPRPEDVRSYEGEALVDTGAVRSVIPQRILQQLGLPVMRRDPVRYADGRSEVVDRTWPVTLQIMGREANEDVFVLGDEILIGQTALESMDLHVDFNNRTDT
jgi:clan AA aspartic protease